MYKFFIITMEPNGIMIMTYDQIEQQFGIKKQQFKKNIKKLCNQELIKSISECETKDLELYTAILTQDYDKINELIIK